MYKLKRIHGLENLEKLFYNRLDKKKTFQLFPCVINTISQFLH